MLLGLNFIFGISGGFYLNRNFITLSKHSYSFPTLRCTNTSEYTRKRGGEGNLDFLTNKQNKVFLENESINLLTNFLTHKLEKGDDVTTSINYSIILHLEKIGLIG